MGERVRAPRRAGGGRRLAAAAALAAVLVGGLAVPSHAEGPTAPAAKVAGDVTGDGKVDVVTATGSVLSVLPAGGAPYEAADRGPSPVPDANAWGNLQVSHRGSATGGRVDDLYVFNAYNSSLYLYPNDANSGGKPGYFTKKDKAVKVAKPATCAAGSDCTGYDPTWNSTSQVLATDGIANKDGMPDLITVEGESLWYYPGKAGGVVIGAPVKLSADEAWRSTVLMAPGKVGGVPTLWAAPANGAVIAGYRLEFGPDGLPVKRFASPFPAFELRSAALNSDGNEQCLVVKDGMRPCATYRSTFWRFATDGTLRAGNLCLIQRGGALLTQECIGEPGQRWKQVADGGLAAADGTCLTVLPGRTYGTRPCDGSPEQSWGARLLSGEPGPKPFPAPLDLVSFRAKSDYDSEYTADSRFTSPGDLDGDGNPELVTTRTAPQGQGTDWVVRRGLDAAGGVGRLGAEDALGDLFTVRNRISEGDRPGSLHVLYSACASLKVDRSGSLVLTELATGKVLWSSNTPGHVDGRMLVRADGHLELIGNDHSSYWSSTGPTGAGAHLLTVQDDCNVVLRNVQATPVWSTRTYDPAHETAGIPLPAGRPLKAGEQVAADRTVLAMGTDGNLVLTDRQTSSVLWTSGTEGRPGAAVALEADGNLVIRDAGGAPLWSSGTWGNPSARLVVQRDGDLVMQDADSKVLWSTGTRYGGVETRGTVIPSGRTVRSGETVESKAGRLVMQPDGNLVLYSKATGNARWSTRTWGNQGAVATVQGDGNLVVKAADGRPLWGSGTWQYPNARAVLQDNLDFVLYGTAGWSAWSTRTDNREPAVSGAVLEPGQGLTSGQALVNLTYGPSVLTMQTDGNLVLANAGRALWSSRTWGNSGARFTLQPDGNAVVYAADGRALWSTGTWGHQGAYLVLRGDGNLVLYDADGVQIWASGTHV
ncbi:hypothetical protein ACWCYY_39635 [Kitasatospora sp. NPDC001664]